MVPASGPQAGGTLITLFGQNLGIGNKNATVCFITDNNLRHCETALTVKTSTPEDHIVATSSPSQGATEITGIEVSFDGNTRREIKSTFEYLPNPIIDTIHPTKSIIR